MGSLASLHVTVYGHVQGVFFRDFTRRHAVALGLTGYARNLSSGQAVEVHAEGEQEKLEELLAHIKVGPPSATVERMDAGWSEYTGRYPDFRVRR